MNEKDTSEYKKIIKSAKTRMLRNDYAEAKKFYQLGLGNSSYYINSKSLTQEELGSLCEKIREIENASEDAFAIGHLVDKNLIGSMNESQQERYVLEIARLYRDIRDKMKECKVGC